MTRNARVPTSLTPFGRACSRQARPQARRVNDVLVCHALEHVSRARLIATPSSSGTRCCSALGTANAPTDERPRPARTRRARARWSWELLPNAAMIAVLERGRHVLCARRSARAPEEGRGTRLAEVRSVPLFCEERPRGSKPRCAAARTMRFVTPRANVDARRHRTCRVLAIATCSFRLQTHAETSAKVPRCSRERSGR